MTGIIVALAIRIRQFIELRLIYSTQMPRKTANKKKTTESSPVDASDVRNQRVIPGDNATAAQTATPVTDAPAATAACTSCVCPKKCEGPCVATCNAPCADAPASTCAAEVSAPVAAAPAAVTCPGDTITKSVDTAATGKTEPACASSSAADCAAAVDHPPEASANYDAISASNTVEHTEPVVHSKGHDPLHKPVEGRERITPADLSLAVAKKTAGSALAAEEARQREAAAEAAAKCAATAGVVDVTEESSATKRKLDDISAEGAANTRDAVVADNAKLCEGNPNTALSAEHAIKRARTDGEDAKEDLGDAKRTEAA